MWDDLTREMRRDQDAGATEGPYFGVFPADFRPYFPEWQECLELPRLEPRDGTFIFRVSLGKACWRLIAMPADATLDDLVGMVLRAFKFDEDHLYEFRYRDRMGTQSRALHPEMDSGPSADQIPIGTLPLETGQTMQLTYDFGDNWEFAVKLERIELPGAKAKPPRILEPPRQVTGAISARRLVTSAVNDQPSQPRTVPHQPITMKTLALSLALVSASAYALSPGEDNVLSAQEKAAGWVLLFDGKTMDGWTTSNGQPSKTPIDEGSINPHKCGGYMMVHKEKWGDFVLALDFKISKGCNSGVFIRTSSPRRGLAKTWGSMESKSPSTTHKGRVITTPAPFMIS